MTQVLIVEDQKMIRESLENLVAQADDLSPAGSLSCAALAEQYCMRGNIDLILMDVCTENDESGFVAAEKIKKRFPSIKIIIITSMLDYSYLDKARKAGAVSYTHLDVYKRQLEDSIVSYKCGEKFYGEYDDGIMWNDPDIAVDWKLDRVGGIDKVILADKDKNLQTFKEFMSKYGGF